MLIYLLYELIVFKIFLIHSILNVYHPKSMIHAQSGALWVDFAAHIRFGIMPFYRYYSMDFELL